MGKVLFMRKGEVHTKPKKPGIAASDLAVGSSVYLSESGTAVEYLVVNKGIPSGSSLYDSSCDGLWLLRKDIVITRQFSTTENGYIGSSLDSYLNGSTNYITRFDATTQAAIKVVKLPSWMWEEPGESGYVSSGTSRQIFLLSAREVTSSPSSSYPKDGAVLEYFNGATNSKRIANYNGTATKWWTRSPSTSSDNASYYVGADGSMSHNAISNQNGVRPALILPHTAIFDSETLLFKEVG